jgi:Adenylate and Guanylate cyclase catalytic domain
LILKTGPSLIHASFFFIDIVGLSDPSMSTKIQIKKIETLNKSIMNCSAFGSTPKATMMALPTGDGMAIGFLQAPELPLKLAIELHGKLSKYNKSKIPAETVRVRIGLHSGPVFIVNDILNNKNVWGPGIIVARRIMDIGDDGHILLSSRTAEDLRELSDQYKQIIKPLYDYTTKHSQKLFLYSAYGKGFGNPKLPTKGLYQMSSPAVGGNEEIEKIKRPAVNINTTIYPSLEVNLSIKNSKTLLVHYKRLYEIQNISGEPIYEVIHGIATDIEKTFDDLNIKVYDEENKPLQISAVPIDKPFQKEFTTVFNKPIRKSDKERRYYVLEYDVEEQGKYFENYFGTNCGRFAVTIEYPSHMSSPVAYEVNLETDEVIKCRIQPIVEKIRNSNDNDKRSMARWAKKDIIQGQSFRFEWK